MSQRGLLHLSDLNAAAGCKVTLKQHPGGLLAILFVTLLVAPVLWAQSQLPPTTTSASKASAESSQGAPSTPTTTGPIDRAIPLPQIADRAAELDRWLEEATDRLATETDLLKAEEEVKSQSEELRKRVKQVDELLGSGIANQSPLAPAERYFEYSNLGLTLVGETVEAVSGETYAQYAKAHVLDCGYRKLHLTSKSTRYDKTL